jgi:hypothetical protein
MPTLATQPLGSREEIVASLERRAVDLWGRARAEAIRPIIEQTAGHIWRISQDPPPADEEPGFYL